MSVRAAFRDEFRLAYEAEGQRRLPDALHWLFTEMVRTDQDALVHHVTFDDAPAILVIQEEQAWLFSSLADDTAQVAHLGPLAGGSYTETARIGESAVEMDLEYVHDRIAGRSIRASTIVPQSENARLVLYADREESIARGEELRRRLTAFASVAVRR